ncbi:hypothetical protein M758_6G211400 [Ceratodon purpureus]|nr:hypothetical protein M758_6G211400 [Ceratodon purpureus]
MAMAMCYSSSSCSGRMALQLVTLHRAFTCSSSSPLLLTRACRLRPGTKSALALAPSSKIIPLPRSYIHATVCPNSSRSFSSRATTPAVRCSTMPLDVETRADVKGDESGMENNGWKIKMLYDGECPLCMREVNMLRERNKNYGDAIKFVDICADGYAAEENCNIDFETVNLDLIIVTVDLPPIDAHFITLVGYMVSREGLGVLSLANWHYSKTAERFIRLLRSGDHGHHCA